MGQAVHCGGLAGVVSSWAKAMEVTGSNRPAATYAVGDGVLVSAFRIVISAIILLVLGSAGPLGCDTGKPAGERFEFSRVRMGSRATVTLYTDTPTRASEAADAVFTRVAAIEEAISDWRVDSEVALLRSRATGQPHSISHDLDGVLTLSLVVSRHSNGAFDVSCGALTRVWREARQANRLPDPQAVEAALATSGYESLHQGTDANGPTLEMDQIGTELDFGGIGKGYAADEALAVLRQHGINRALVDLGGDMALGDPPPGQPGWRISFPDSGPIVVLANRGVATSGATEQYLQVESGRFSHILDPRTGQAMPDRGQITVVAPTAAEADAWASVALVVGVKVARQLVPVGSGIRFMAIDQP